MRIAYVAKMFPRVSETFIANEISELKRRGLDVSIVSLLPTTVTRLWPEVEPLAAETYELPDPSTHLRLVASSQWRHLRRAPFRYFLNAGRVARRFSRRSWKRFFQAGLLLDHCQAHGISHIHAAFAHTPTSVAIWTQRLGDVTYSMSAHAKDLYLSDPISIRRKMDEARFVWTCTGANGRYLRGLGSSTPVDVGYHGTDLTRFRPGADGERAPGDPSRTITHEADATAAGTLMEPADPPMNGPTTQPPLRIITLCRLVPKKGLPDLLEAASILRNESRADFTIRIGGDGPERARLEADVRRLGLEDTVQFVGTLLSEDVLEFYRSADVFVLPCVILENGDRDGIPNVLVEAIASGLPVVSTRVSGIPELIEDGVSGLLVDPGDPGALAGALAEVQVDLPAARRRADLARAAVQKRFDLRINSERLAQRLETSQRANRALYVTADLGIPVRGHKGASAHVRQISEQLDAHGISLSVLSPEPGPESPEGNAFGIPIVSVSPSPLLSRWMKRFPKGSWRRDMIKEFRRLALNVPVWQELSRRPRPDFVYERYSLCAIATGLYCRWRHIPWILEVNAPLADEEAEFRGLRWGWLTRALERWNLRRAGHVYVVSHALRSWAIEQGVHPDRVTTLPNGVDRDRFHPENDGRTVREDLGIAPTEIVFAFAGSLKPWHGGEVLLESFERARQLEPKIRLLYIGEGPERKALQKRCQKHGLDDVLFTGAVPHDRVPALLAAADVLVAPYLPHDRFYFSPLKVLEYLAAGRPVIASEVGEISAWVDSTCGRLVPAGNAKHLKNAMIELAADRDLRISLARRARRRTRRDDWSARAATVLRQIETLRGIEPNLPVDRVGYILKMFPRFSETFVLREILELEKQGMEIRTFSMKTPTGPRQAELSRVRARQQVLCDPSSVTLKTIAVQLRCFLHWPRGYFQAARFAATRGDRKAIEKLLQAGEIALACRRERIAHLHAHFASGPTRVAKLTSMICGVPFSFTAHAKDLYWQGHRHGTSKKLKKRVQRARFVAVISEENKNFIEGQNFAVKPGRVRPIYIGIQLEDYAFTAPSDRPSSHRPTILAIGRLIEKKGFHILLDAAAILQDRGLDARIVIAGEGPEEDSLRTRIEELSLKNVELLGAIPLQRLREDYYSSARVLAQPCIVAQDGDQDGIPTVLVEAMALGVPVISTRVSGIPEAIADGVNGFLIEPNDAGSLADRIGMVLQDEELADRLAAAGRARVEAQFDLEKNVGALHKLFRRSIAGWPAREEWVEIQQLQSRSSVGPILKTLARGRRPASLPEGRTAPTSVAFPDEANTVDRERIFAPAVAPVTSIVPSGKG